MKGKCQKRRHEGPLEMPLLSESKKKLSLSHGKHMGAELQRTTNRLTDSWCANFQSTILSFLILASYNALEVIKQAVE